MMKYRELFPRSNQHTSLKLTINTINNNTSGFIYPSTRARQSRALFLLGSLLSLQVVLTGRQLPLPALAEPLLLQQVLKTQTVCTLSKPSQSLLFLQSLEHLSTA
jgi:hypothetical protein